MSELREQMMDKAWNRDRAARSSTRFPVHNKDLAKVMADQADLVEAEHTMREILNYKGS